MVAGLVGSGTCVGNGSVRCTSLVLLAASGRPGGWSCPVSVTAVAMGKLEADRSCFQGNEFSSK
eukprot:1922206-Pleurochrysis_carterae.AAC.1